MPKPKKKLTPEQKRAKRLRKEQFQTIFINGKQKRVRREPLIEGLPVDEFIRQNADPIWLHQNEMWEYIEPEPDPELDFTKKSNTRPICVDDDDDLPF